MIFVTVGTELPFDRLVRAVDDWAARLERSDVFAQIGPTAWRPSHIKWTCFLDPAECRARVASARVVVAHAGMGTILTAFELGKPIMIMPRRAELQEHRSNHQIATAMNFRSRRGLTVAMQTDELLMKLEALDRLPVPDRISTHAPPALVERLLSFIELGVNVAGTDVPANAAIRRPQPASHELNLQPAEVVG